MWGWVMMEIAVRPKWGSGRPRSPSSQVCSFLNLDLKFILSSFSPLYFQRLPAHEASA